MKVYTSGIGTMADPDDVFEDLRLEREERIRQRDVDESRRTCERMEARASMRKYHLPVLEGIR